MPLKVFTNFSFFFFSMSSYQAILLKIKDSCSFDYDNSLRCNKASNKK